MVGSISLQYTTCTRDQMPQVVFTHILLSAAQICICTKYHINLYNNCNWSNGIKRIRGPSTHKASLAHRMHRASSISDSLIYSSSSFRCLGARWQKCPYSCSILTHPPHSAVREHAGRSARTHAVYLLILLILLSGSVQMYVLHSLVDNFQFLRCVSSM